MNLFINLQMVQKRINMDDFISISTFILIFGIIPSSLYHFNKLKKTNQYHLVTKVQMKPKERKQLAKQRFERTYGSYVILQ